MSSRFANATGWFEADKKLCQNRQNKTKEKPLER